MLKERAFIIRSFLKEINDLSKISKPNWKHITALLTINKCITNVGVAESKREIWKKRDDEKWGYSLPE